MSTMRTANGVRRGEEVNPRIPLLPVLIVTIIVIHCALGGCSAPRYDTVTLSVSEAGTGAPVAGAEVRVRPLKFYLPMGDSPSPTPGDFEGDFGVTDAAGLITLRAAGNAPSEVFITHPDYPLWRGLLEPWETAAGEAAWQINPAGPAAQGATPAMRVDVR